jgi:hypothetical protein
MSRASHVCALNGVSIKKCDTDEVFSGRLCESVARAEVLEEDEEGRRWREACGGGGGGGRGKEVEGGACVNPLF